MSQLHVFDHPLITHKLSIMRNKKTGSKDFRELLNEIAMLMGYELTRDLPLEDIEIETPICKMTAKRIAGKKLAIVPILRAGLGMVDGIQSLVPVAKVGHIGLYRDPETHLPVEYYCKMPPDIDERIVILVDPMLATGGSASDAITMVKARGAKSVMLMCLVAAPEGVAKTNMAMLAFGEVFGSTGAGIFVAICLFFFAFSTIISWNLFGKVNVVYLFGKKSEKIYAAIAVIFVFLGSCLSNDLVWELTDMFNQLMVLPNVLALAVLSGIVAVAAKTKKAKKEKAKK